MTRVETMSSVLSTRDTLKPRVLTFASHYLPAFKAGGPPRSISNLVHALSSDFDFLIVTRDRDLGDLEPYPHFPRDVWVHGESGRVMYLSPTSRRLMLMARLIRETPHDVLFLNSVFDAAYTLQPLIARRMGMVPARPTIIAPRGEFGSGALALKRARKTLYLGAAQRLGLFENALWMASSAREAEDIHAALGIDPESIAVASDLADANMAVQSGPPERAPGAPLRIIFLARISPMKNLEYALDLLSGMGDLPLTLDVVGPCSDPGYLRMLQRRAEQMPSQIRVKFAGEVKPEQVRTTLTRYDLMLLPTRGENFGHVILESLQAGTPVLISDRTPWRTTPDGACLTVSLDEPDEFRRIIRQRMMASSQEQARLRAAARLHAARFSEDPSHKAANRALFIRAAAQDRAPTIVKSTTPG